jgi:hypothetical protein
MAGTEDELSIGLFGDPLWLVLERVHWLLWHRLHGDPHTAALDLTEALATLVPSMRRSRREFSDRERLRFEFWDEHELAWEDGRLIVKRKPAHHLARVDIIEGFVGYAWLPALAQVPEWSGIFGPMLPMPQKSQSRPQGPQPGASKLEQSQSEELKPPPLGCKAEIWVHYAVKKWPRGKDESSRDYVTRLLMHAPKAWARHTIQNALSVEAKFHR